MEKENFLNALAVAELSLLGIANSDLQYGTQGADTPASAAPDFTEADYRSAAG